MGFEEAQKKHWDNIKKRRNPYNPVVRAFALPKIEIISDSVSLKNNSSVLEVGCGSGYFTVYLAQRWDITGLDYSSKMLSLNPHRKLIEGNVEKMPFDDGSFEMVICTNLLHHLPDCHAAIIEMKRVTGCYLAFIEPNRTNPAMLAFSLIKKSEWGAIKFSKKYLEKLLLDNNLKILKSVSHGSITPNVVREFMLPFLRPLNVLSPLGLYNVIIASK